MIRHIATIPTVVPSVVPSRRPTSAPSGGVRSRLIASYITESLGNLPATSRATVSPMYADASGDLVQYAANNVALVNGDSVACWPGWTNKNTNHNWKPSATTNVTLTDSEGNATLTVVDDTTELEAAGISGNGNAFKIDASANTTTDCYAVIGGATGNTNAHYASAYIRSDGGGTGAELSVTGTSAPATSSSLASNADYVRESFGFTPGNADNQIQVRVTPGETAYFLLNVLTETSYLTAPIEVAGSSVAVDASEPVVPWPSGLVNDFVVKIVTTPQGFPSNFGFFGNMGNSDGLIIANTGSGTKQLRVQKKSNNSFLSAANTAVTLSAGTTYTLIVHFSSINGFVLWVNGTKGSVNSNTDDIESMADTVGLGDGLNAGQGACVTKTKTIKIIKVPPNITDDEILSL